MRRTHPPYDAAYRQRIVELVQSGRTLASIAKEFGCTTKSIACWVKQAGLESPAQIDVLTTDEKTELTRLRREVRILREEKIISKKPRPGLPRKAQQCPSCVQIHESEPGRASDCDDEPSVVGDPERLLRVAETAPEPATAGGRLVGGQDSRGTRRVRWNVWCAANPSRIEGRGYANRCQACCSSDEV